jgi:HK97 family phage prohead protease
MAENRDIRQTRSVSTEFKTRSEGDDKYIEGYFVVFNSIYEMWDGATESIAPGAFDNTLSDDIRALVNHDSTLVLGRTAAHTLELTQDERGLFGRIKINPNDSDAMNLYARVQRGDVSQCSFGFDILSEETDFRDDGSVHWTITDVKLYEVSCCTFPAYEATSINARKRDYEELRAKQTDAWRARMLNRLKEEH